MGSGADKKFIHLFTLMEKLSQSHELYALDNALCEELNINSRTLRRYLDELHIYFSHVLVTEKKLKTIDGKRLTVYRISEHKKDISDTLRYFLEERNELEWVLSMIHANDPTFLTKDSNEEKKEIERSIAKDKDIFLFRSNPFENLQSAASLKYVSLLKKAVKNHEYRTIVYEYDQVEHLENVKCLKIIFTNNNWYLAIETQEDMFRLLRISFIKEVLYSKTYTSYRSNVLLKYTSYFETMQNAMSLCGVPMQTAIIKATPCVARYFQEGMKPFFISQKMLHVEPDGSIIFSLHYTQPIEILPFIKQWIPDLIIVEPSSLRKLFENDMRKSLSLVSKD